jgi:hypothetical protein
MGLVYVVINAGININRNIILMIECIPLVISL